MTKETRLRIAKLYKEGKWNQKDKVAKQWADELIMEENQEEQQEEVQNNSEEEED